MTSQWTMGGRIKAKLLLPAQKEPLPASAGHSICLYGVGGPGFSSPGMTHMPVPVLQAAQCQTIRDLSACLLGQSLRVDCHFENKTSNPLTYEFSIIRDTRKRVINSNMNIPESTYRARSNITLHRNLIHLYLSSFTTSDEGLYICELKATNDYTGHQVKNITVIKGEWGGVQVSAPSSAAAPGAPGGNRESRFHLCVAHMWSEFAGSQPESWGRTEGPLQARLGRRGPDLCGCRP